VVRDPRDMLVSLFFSTKFSHGYEARGTAQFSALMRRLIEDSDREIDDYCLFYSWLVNYEFFLHREIARDPNTKVVRYEDFIYDKRRLVADIDAWFGLDVPELVRGDIAAAHQALPQTERPENHMRQAHPGDFRRKLQADTVAALNAVLADYLQAFGYSR
jgi:hypothetical protein